MTAGTGERPRLDGSMSLLVDMMSNTLDESYAEAARRREGDLPQGGPARRGAASARSRIIAALLLVALGLVTGIAAAQVKRREASQGGARAGLVKEIQRRTAETDALARQTASARELVARLQTAGLTAGAFGTAAARQLAALELAAGVGAVTGPGIVVRLDDAVAQPDSAAGRKDVGLQPGSAGRVLDRDVQDAVNGLWAAGAEAISVNDLRLTAQTAIRSAGEAILVDFRPLSPPYLIRAIGSRRLEPTFVDGVTGRRLESYTTLYGVRFSVSAADRVRLPGAGSPRLRYALAERKAS